MTKAKEMRELTSGIDVDANGNVGIGTNSASELLHANGSIRLTTDVSTTRRLYALSGTGPYALNSSGGAAIAFHRDATNNDEIAFETHWQGNQHAERMRIDNQGNVGIGTDSPSSLLDVDKSQNSETNIEITNTNTGADAQVRTKYTTDGGLFTVGKTSNAHVFGGDAYLYNVDNTNIRFATSDIERVRIDSSGNVGIGETNPAGKLEVQNTSVNYAILGTSNKGHYFESQSDDNTDGFEIYQQHGSTATRNSFIVNDNRTGSKSAAFAVRGDGRIGIGTSSPVSRLDIRGGTVNVDYDGTGGVAYVQKTFSTIHDAGNRTGDIAFGLVDGSFGGMIARNVVGGNASFNSQHLEFHTHNGGINAGERMRIDVNGNVGIGTSSPATKVDIDNSTSNSILTLTTNSFNGAARVGVNFQVNGFASTPSGQIALVGNNNYSGDMIFSTALPGTTNPLSERMRINSDGAVVINNSGGDAQLYFGGTSGTSRMYLARSGLDSLLFNVSSGNLRFGTNNTEAMRIDSGGSLRLGTTGNEGITNRLTVKYNGAGIEYGMVMKPAADNTVPIYFQNASGGNVGSVGITSSSTSYNTTSDYRLKENVTDVTDGITRVKQLEPKRFNFIVDPDTTVDGFLAHEAQAVVPEAVTGTHNEVDDDGNAVMQGIDQSKLVPLLTAALKESIAKIEALEARVTALES